MMELQHFPDTPCNELLECRRRVEELERPERLRDKQEEVDNLESIIQKHVAALAKAAKALEVETTTRRLAEESRAHLASIVQHVEEAVIGKTLDGVITSWNPAAERIFGYSAEEAVGKSITMLFPPELVEEERFILGRVKEQGFIENYETVRLTKSGKRIEVSITVSPMRDQSGKIVGLSSIKRNILQGKEIEAALAGYIDSLEQSNRELQEFASVASHDLQEPLRKIQMFSDRLLARYGEALGEDGRDSIDRMKKASNRMRELIDALLSYSRLTTQAQPFSAIDLREIVHEVINDLEGRIEDTDGVIDLGELPAIEGDPSQMRQLFQNLIGNALKFHGHEAPRVRISGNSCREGFCEISIEDNGIGFDENYRERIFAPFQRLHTRKEYEGTGMGLAICKKIVERHGGTITARSTPGKGAAFIVTLPVAQKKPPASASP